jgi:hypothetical protein
MEFIFGKMSCVMVCANNSFLQKEFHELLIQVNCVFLFSAKRFNTSGRFRHFFTFGCEFSISIILLNILFLSHFHYK